VPSSSAQASYRAPSIWRLGGLAAPQLAREVAAEIRAKNFLGRASELAFDFLFALFPLIVFMLSLFGIFASRSVELQQDFLSYFSGPLPPLAFELLKKVTSDLANNASGGKLTLGILTALWFASGGVASMISALNLTYQVRESRSWIKVRLIALALTFSISILVFAALVLVLLSGHALDWFGALLGLRPIMILVWKIAQWPAAILFVLVSYSLIYFYGPDLNSRWRWITPGSIFGSLVWLAGSAGFRIYLHFFNTYSASYNSLGAVMILLAWLYISGLAFLIGGEINGQIERRLNFNRN
jgi:membrane protein